MRMKTAISLPDPLFRSAEQLAKRLKVSRSALYATAVADYVAQHQRNSVTARLNEVYGEGGEDSTLDPVVAGLQWHSLPKDEW
jgi:predicted transcriptional regulator